MSYECGNLMTEELLLELMLLIVFGFLLCVLISFTVEKKQKLETLKRYKNLTTELASHI